MTVFDHRLSRRFDIPLLLITYTIAILGVVIIYFSTRNDPTVFYKKQIVSILLGTVAMVAMSLFDYHRLARYATHLYVLNLGLLGLVLNSHFTHQAKGAGRWIKIAGFPFQPSELAKVITIITLAVLLTRHPTMLRRPTGLLLSFLYIVPSFALIFKQPDLGTSLVILAIWAGMVFIAGANVKHIATFFISGMLIFGIALNTPIIKDYQRNRLITFINPDADPKSKGYHVVQARIAIGSGEMLGKGLTRSTQVQNGYIPEHQTDFIFTAIGESLGFIGCVSVIGLYMLLLYRGLRVVADSDEDRLGKLIAAGIITMFAFHILVNISMNIGLLPVIGVPLMLISVGGTNVMMCLACVGILQSISINRKELFF